MPFIRDMITKIRNKNFREAAGTIFYTASFLFVVVIMIYYAFRDSVSPFGEFLRTVGSNFGFFSLALLMLIVAIIAEVIRFANLLYQATGKIRLVEAFRMAMYGRFVESLSPYGIGTRGAQRKYLTRINTNYSVSYTVPYIQSFIKLVIFNLLFALFFIFVRVQEKLALPDNSRAVV